MEAANPATNDNTTSKNGLVPTNLQVANKPPQNTRTTKNPSQNPQKPRHQSQERNGNNRPQYQQQGQNNQNNNQQYQHQGQNSQNNNQHYEAKPRNSRRGGGKRQQYNRADEQEGQQQNETHQKMRISNRFTRDPNILSLRAHFNNYFPDETLVKALEQNNNDLDRTKQQLHVQKEHSWSNIVVKSSPAPQYHQVENLPHHQAPQLVVETHVQNHTQGHEYPAENYYQPRQKPQRHRKPQHIAPPEPTLPKEEDYNADEKSEAIQRALEVHLSAMESRTEKIKRLQEDIRKITADRDVKISHLSSEKERLVQNAQQLRQEILVKDKRVVEIDAEVARLRQERIQKIRSLEEESSRALLSDK